MNDREIAELAVQDGIRILTAAGAVQPFISPGCKRAWEAHQEWLADKEAR